MLETRHYQACRLPRGLCVDCTLTVRWLLQSRLDLFAKVPHVVQGPWVVLTWPTATAVRWWGLRGPGSVRGPHVAHVCLRRVLLASRGPPRAPPSWPEEHRTPSSLSTKQSRARNWVKRRVTDHRPTLVQHEGLRLVSVRSCHYCVTIYQPLGPTPRTASSFVMWLRLPFLYILAPEPPAGSPPPVFCAASSVVVESTKNSYSPAS